MCGGLAAWCVCGLQVPAPCMAAVPCQRLAELTPAPPTLFPTLPGFCQAFKRQEWPRIGPFTRCSPPLTLPHIAPNRKSVWQGGRPCRNMQVMGSGDSCRCPLSSSEAPDLRSDEALQLHCCSGSGWLGNRQRGGNRHGNGCMQARAQWNAVNACMDELGRYRAPRRRGWGGSIVLVPPVLVPHGHITAVGHPLQMPRGKAGLVVARVTCHQPLAGSGVGWAPVHVENQGMVR